MKRVNLSDSYLSLLCEQSGEYFGSSTGINLHVGNRLVAEILIGKELEGSKLRIVRKTCLQLEVAHADG